MSGRIETDLFSGKTEICNSGPWRVQTSESKCRNRQDAWYSERKYLYLKSGNVLELSDKEAKVVDNVHTGEILVDGLGVGDVGNIVLRDRQHLAEDGIMIVVLTLEKGSNQLLAGPDIVSRGFVYVRESESLMEEARKVLTEAVEDCLTHQRNADWSKIKLVIRDTMNDFIWKRTKRRPMILPIIMDV